MDDRSNLTKLIEAGRQDEAIALLREGVMLRPVIGERSAIAALAFANALASGNLMGTARWMTKYSTALRGTATEIAETSDEPSWRTIWHRFEREEGAVVNAIGALQDELANFRYREPGEILHIFGMMLLMTDINLLEANRDSVVESAMNYIVALRERGELPPLNPNSYMEHIRHGAWAGLSFTDAGSEHFKHIYNFLGEQRQLARLERLPTLAVQLMKELREDPDLFCRRLVGPRGEGSDLGRVDKVDSQID